MIVSRKHPAISIKQRLNDFVLGNSYGISAGKGWNPWKYGFDLGVGVYTKDNLNPTTIASSQERDEDGWYLDSKGIDPSYGKINIYSIKDAVYSGNTRKLNKTALDTVSCQYD